MATFTHPRLPTRTATAPRPPRTSRQVRRAEATGSRTVTSQPVTGYDSTHEPSRAASVLPVLLAFGGLLVLAVGAAYFGREAISLLGLLLKPS